MPTSTLTIDDRFQGLPGLALGGYTGGRLAEHLGDTTGEVTFHRPVPTDEALELTRDDGVFEVCVDGEAVATAQAASVDVAVPTTVSHAEAVDASEAYLGHYDHPSPGCFTCGTERASGEGLGLFAGPVGTDGVVAAPWTPESDLADGDGAVTLRYVWAALDCPSIWAVMEAAPADDPGYVVSGRLAVRTEAPVRAGEDHVVVAWPLERRSGTWLAGAAVLDADGDVKAVALHTLVVTDWGVPLGVSRPDA